MKKIGKRILTSTGFSVDDALRDARKELRTKDEEITREWHQVFDRAVDRSRSMTHLILRIEDGLPGTNAEREALIVMRDEHLRLARGLAKLLWRVVP